MPTFCLSQVEDERLWRAYSARELRKTCPLQPLDPALPPVSEMPPVPANSFFLVKTATHPGGSSSTMEGIDFQRSNMYGIHDITAGAKRNNPMADYFETADVTRPLSSAMRKRRPKQRGGHGDKNSTQKNNAIKLRRRDTLQQKMRRKHQQRERRNRKTQLSKQRRRLQPPGVGTLTLDDGGTTRSRRRSDSESVLGRAARSQKRNALNATTSLRRGGAYSGSVTGIASSPRWTPPPLPLMASRRIFGRVEPVDLSLMADVAGPPPLDAGGSSVLAHERSFDGERHGYGSGGHHKKSRLQASAESTCHRHVGEEGSVELLNLEGGPLALPKKKSRPSTAPTTLGPSENDVRAPTPSGMTVVVKESKKKKPSTKKYHQRQQPQRRDQHAAEKSKGTPEKPLLQPTLPAQGPKALPVVVREALSTSPTDLIGGWTTIPICLVAPPLRSASSHISLAIREVREGKKCRCFFKLLTFRTVYLFF